MERRTLLLGAAALAAGCGGGAPPSSGLRFRDVSPGAGVPLGLDDFGKVYLTTPGDADLVRFWQPSTDRKGSFRLTAETGSFRHVRPDGVVVCERGYILPGAGFTSVALPSLAAFSFDGETFGDDRVTLSDADGSGSFIGNATRSNNLGFQNKAFVVRLGVLATLAQGGLEARQLLPDGTVLGVGLPNTQGDRNPARLFGPDNQLADHVINTDASGFWIDSLSEELAFVGWRVGTAGVDLQSVQGDRLGIVSRPRLYDRQRLNSVGDLLVLDRFDPATLQLELPEGSPVALQAFLSEPQRPVEIVGLNRRREVLGYYLDGEAFLLVPSVLPD